MNKPIHWCNKSFLDTLYLYCVRLFEGNSEQLIDAFFPALKNHLIYFSFFAKPWTAVLFNVYVPQEPCLAHPHMQFWFLNTITSWKTG